MRAPLPVGVDTAIESYWIRFDVTSGGRLGAARRSSPLSDHALARYYCVAAPTVRKWRERDSTADRSHRPDTLHCTLTPAQEAVAMAIRKTLWLPLDDLLVVVAIDRATR